MRKFQLLASTLLLMTLLAIPALSASAEPAQTAGGSGCAVFYTVKPGDTLSRIAVRFDTTVAKLASLNGIANPDRIWADSTLCVREQPAGFSYTVKRGDTLTRLSVRYGWPVKYLAEINKIKDPNKIKIGQVLFIPNH